MSVRPSVNKLDDSAYQTHTYIYTYAYSYTRVHLRKYTHIHTHADTRGSANLQTGGVHADNATRHAV